MSISRLPENVRAQIKSTVEITSLSDVVVELFKNCLDADAGAITITLDFAKGFCSVDDDGVGIPASEFNNDGSIGQLHCTSKSGRDTFGRNGRFLYCLSALSLLSISSRERSATCSSVLVIQRAEVISRQVWQKNSNTHGTSVTVHNLFGHLPVRFKAQAANAVDLSQVEKQFEALKLRLLAHLLAIGRPISLRVATTSASLRYHHAVSVAESDKAWFSKQNLSSLFRQVKLSTTPDAWRTTSAKAGSIAIRAAICSIPQSSKRMQFISFGKHPIPVSGFGAMLYDTVNSAFELSTFGAIESQNERPNSTPAARNVPEYTQAELRTNIAKGVDRWPYFYVRVDVKNESLQAERAEQEEIGTTSTFQEVLALLRVLMAQFLESEHMKPRRLPRHRNGDRAASGPALAARPTGAFDGWNKTKHSVGITKEDLLCGLPFQDGQTRVMPEIFDQDVQPLLDDLELDSIGLHDETSTAHASAILALPSRQLDGDEKTLMWKNPHTGNLLRINASNGIVIPAEQRESNDDSPSEPSFEIRAPSLRTRMPLLTRNQLASRLEKWSTGRNVKTQASIPSLIPDETSPDAAFASHELEAASLANASVIGQVDKKFILCIVLSQKVNSPCSHLLLIDQHAADERIKVEEYYQQICSGERTVLARPILFDVSNEEAAKFQQAQVFFSSWAIDYHVRVSSNQPDCNGTLPVTTVAINHLPPIITERCRLEPRIIIDILRREIWGDSGHWRLRPPQASWVSRMMYCPEGLLDMLKSRACRSAIMFNDTLTADQCQRLLASLSKCSLPFQCAHGRQSMTLITTLGEHASFGSDRAGAPNFGDAFRRWNK